MSSDKIKKEKMSHSSSNMRRLWTASIAESVTAAPMDEKEGAAMEEKAASVVELEQGDEAEEEKETEGKEENLCLRRMGYKELEEEVEEGNEQTEILLRMV